MSAKASAYAKDLVVCPSGERISRGEKLVLIVLADNHQDKSNHFTYPSIDTIAVDALCDRRTCQRHLASLERKGVIARMRPPGYGRGNTIFYFFRALDSIPEGWQNATFFESSLFAIKGGKKAAKGRQNGGILSTASIKNINRNDELKTSTPPTPSLREGDAALVDRVMVGCGFTARRLRRVIAEQMALEAGKEADPLTTADAMIAAWKSYQQQDCNLRVKFGARRFFEDGYWREPRSWHYDTEMIREKQRRREASAGSWG